MNTILVTLFCMCYSFSPNLGKVFLPFNPWQINYNVFYGPENNVSMRNIFLLPAMEEIDINNPMSDDISYSDDEELETDDFMGGSSHSRPNFADVKDYEQIKDVLYNITGEMSKTRRKEFFYNEWLDTPWFLSLTDPSFPSWSLKNNKTKRTPEINEEMETQRVRSFIVTFFLHARYKLKEAIFIRSFVKNTKGYKLGYLFNRLRQYLLDMRKHVLEMNELEKDPDLQDFDRNVILYQQVVRRRVDFMDCLRHIEFLDFTMPEKTKKSSISRT